MLLAGLCWGQPVLSDALHSLNLKPTATGPWEPAGQPHDPPRSMEIPGI